MLWLARDKVKAEDETWYVLSIEKPRLAPTGHWVANGLGDYVALKARQCPVKLKPGEGPVRVRLVKA